jgi:hypothetical protein
MAQLMANTAANRARFAKHPPITKDTLVLHDADQVQPPPPPPKPKKPIITVNGRSDLRRYKGYRGGKREPRCANRGCDKTLRMAQPLCCSQACCDAVFARAMGWLLRLDVTPEQILDYVKQHKAGK